MGVLDIDSGYLSNIKQDLNSSIFEAARRVTHNIKTKVTLTLEFSSPENKSDGVEEFEKETEIDYNIKVTTQEIPFQNKDYTAPLALSENQYGILTARRADGQISVFDSEDDDE
ncbi:hypothetical protein ACQRBK_07775 [Peptoniphilaceae bacterium SGI.137]|nr:hypothetical protein [Peptoniphilaceae bacterium]MDY5765905.1 hypothetical protein [Peptoniphilaceae bacterium]MDY6146206.1 hypothetical protein [Peptoniphilaceae bacterium]